MRRHPASGSAPASGIRGCVGDEAVNAEDHTTICGEEEPAYRRSKAKYVEREREREREAKRISLFIKNATITNNNNNSNNNLLKVTKSIYIVTHLGQLPFILFT